MPIGNGRWEEQGVYSVDGLSLHDSVYPYFDQDICVYRELSGIAHRLKQLYWIIHGHRAHP